MSAASLVVVGSGALANATCDALATIASTPTDVVVIGRNGPKIESLCYIATTLAGLADRPVSFRPAPVDGYDSDDQLARVLRSAAPNGVFLCASRQSPWEAGTAPSAWTALLARAGFGLTLPLHADLAVRVGRTVAATCPDAWLVNACFPDAVNPLLAELDVPVLAGIGNVATLAASAQAALGLPDQSSLRMLAHHAHLHEPSTPEDEAQVWLDGTPVAAVTPLLAAQRATPRPELNRITGATAARFLHALLTGAELATHAPGPGARPGGYPVWLRDGRVELRLPDGVSETEAVARNQRFAVADGVQVIDGEVRFAPTVAAALREPAPHLADGFRATELAGACRDLLALRDRLRGT
jgi:hypothetical protein